MFRDMGYLGGEDNVDYMMYKTPILVWDNYAQLSGELKTRSTFQIMPTVFEQYNLEMPAYYRFLLSLQEETLGISHGKVYLDSEGDAWELDTELSENYKEMELLQYDYIYGKRYGEKVFH